MGKPHNVKPESKPAQFDPYLECQRCKQSITAETRVWLALDTRTGKYQAGPVIPPEFSQGEFPFGPYCARYPNKPYKGPR